MPWTVNLDERFPWHRKVARVSDQAFRLHIHAICWASREQTDGALSPDDLTDVAPRLRNRERLAAELVRAGLWVETGTLGWVIHDYLEWQPSRATRRAMDEQKQSSGQLGAHRRWHEKRRIQDPDCKYCIGAG
jgi:hypothetical protein